MKALRSAIAVTALVVAFGVVAPGAEAAGGDVTAWVVLDCASENDVVVNVVNSGGGSARVAAQLDGGANGTERVNLDAGASQDIGLGSRPDGLYQLRVSISGGGEILSQAVEVDCVDEAPPPSTTPATPSPTPTPTPTTPPPTPPTPTGPCTEPTASPAGQAPVFRFWSPVYQGHFYTLDAGECRQVVATLSNLWTYEGIAFHAFSQRQAGTVPLYRFFSRTFNGHFYTVNQAERDNVMATMPDLWTYEGVAYYVYPPGSDVADTSGVYRFWSPTVKHHFYTASTAERDSVRTRLQNMWTYESEAFRIPNG